jgi:hypothetical protein
MAKRVGCGALVQRRGTEAHGGDTRQVARIGYREEDI